MRLSVVFLALFMIVPVLRIIGDRELYKFETGISLEDFNREFFNKILYQTNQSPGFVVIIAKPKPIWYLDFGTAVYVFFENHLNDFTYNVDNDLEFLERHPEVIEVLRSEKYQAARQELAR